jgi:hypothetical protein
MSREYTPSDDPEYRTAEQTDRSQGHSRRQFLSRVTAVGLSAAVAGCSSLSESVGLGQQTESPSHTARLVLDGAPDGLRKFEATIRSTTGSSISEINPGVIDGDEFQIASGGVGNIETTVRAVDLSGSVGAFSDQRPLVAVEFDSEIYDSAVDVSTSQVTNDAGERITQERISLKLTE